MIDRDIVQSLEVQRIAAARENTVQDHLRVGEPILEDFKNAFDTLRDLSRILIEVPGVVGSDHQHSHLGTNFPKVAMRQPPNHVFGPISVLSPS